MVSRFIFEIDYLLSNHQNSYNQILKLDFLLIENASEQNLKLIYLYYYVYLIHEFNLYFDFIKFKVLFF